MRIIRILQTDQDLITRFMAVLGRGLAAAGGSQSKSARPGFFVFAGNFIHEYLEPTYFKKEEVLLHALEDCGFPADDGPVGSMYADHRKSREMSQILAAAARQWQGGEEIGRQEVIWATSEYIGVLHRHFELLRNLIHPLLEQTLSTDDEEKAAESLNLVAFQDPSQDSPDKYVRIVEMLEEEVREWG
jgi:hemerythrin-like domain-containing protein